MAEANPNWQLGVKERYDAFALNYCVNGYNGALAVRETKGYSNKYARTTARRLSTIDYVKRRISEIKAEMKLKYEGTHEQLTQDFARYAVIAEHQGNIIAATGAKREVAKHKGYYYEDNAQRKPEIEIRTFTTMEELRIYINEECEGRDKSIAATGTGIAV